MIFIIFDFFFAFYANFLSTINFVYTLIENQWILNIIRLHNFDTPSKLTKTQLNNRINLQILHILTDRKKVL